MEELLVASDALVAATDEGAAEDKAALELLLPPPELPPQPIRLITATLRQSLVNPGLTPYP